MIKYLSGILIGIWFILLIQNIFGIINIGWIFMILLTILVFFITVICYVIDLFLETKNIAKNIGNTGLKLANIVMNKYSKSDNK